MIRIPLFGKKKLLLAFEYAVILSETAKEQNVELTPEIIHRAEEMLMNEFLTKNPDDLSIDLEANILSIFETDLSSNK